MNRGDHRDRREEILRILRVLSVLCGTTGHFVARSEGGHYSIVKRALARRPGHAAAAEQVQVDVKDGLAGVAVGIEDRSEPRG